MEMVTGGRAGRDKPVKKYREAIEGKARWG